MTATQQEVSVEEAASEAGVLRGWNVPGLDYPALRLLLVAKAIERLNTRIMAEISGFTMAEWRVLSRLAPEKGATVRQIAELAWSDRAEVSRAVASLEARGFLARRANSRDRRAPIHYCTEAGLREHARIIPLRGTYYDAIAAGLDAEECAMLERSLRKIGGNVALIAERGMRPAPIK